MKPLLRRRDVAHRERCSANSMNPCTLLTVVFWELFHAEERKTHIKMEDNTNLFCLFSHDFYSLQICS